VKTLFFLVLLVPAALAQTPFEFAVVRELVQGEPFVSVMRIELCPADPAPGRTTLEIASRVGLDLSPRSHSLYPDTSSLFAGQTLYTVDVDEGRFTRLLQVLSDQSVQFHMNVTDLYIDLVSPDDMSWLTLACPMSLADSLLDGRIDMPGFWARADVRSVEIGTGGYALEFEPPVSVIRQTVEQTGPVIETFPGTSGHAWKSLLVPGWGQLSSGQGCWWLNMLVEAGAVGLVASGYEAEGLAVLGANHIVSFFDLL
jgi:hypothetical protein